MPGSSRTRRPLTLRRGADVVGYVVVTGGDNYWWLGGFTPGPDFDEYRPVFERERELSRAANEADGEAYCDASDAWQAALEEINRPDLRLGDPGEPIWDFKIDDQSRVEFKLGWGLTGGRPPNQVACCQVAVRDAAPGRTRAAPGRVKCRK